MSKAFVTGASGHIGSALIPLLVKKKWEVRALVRETSRLDALRGIPIDLVRGDIGDGSLLKEAMEGCEAVFHLAAPTVVRTDSDAQAVIGGVHNITHALEGKKKCRLIYVSSTVTVGVVPSPLDILNEQTHMHLTGTRYQDVKWEAEKEILKNMRDWGLDIVIVNPSTIMGPGDFRPTPPHQLVVDFMKYAGTWDWIRDRNFKGAPVFFDTGFSIVHVQDVAQGIFAAFEKGKRGERYILGGSNTEIREMYRILSNATGLPAPKWYIPKPLMLVLSWILTSVMKHPPMSYTLAKNMVGKFAFFSSEKSIKELGYSFRPAEETLQDAVRWILDNTSLVPQNRAQAIRKSMLRLHTK